MKTRAPFVRALRVCVPAATAAMLLGACAGAPQTDSGAPRPVPAAVRSEVPRLAPTQPPSDLGAIERFAWQQVVQLGEAFAAGDVDGFLARVSRGFYRSYSFIESSLHLCLFTASFVEWTLLSSRLPSLPTRCV